MTDLSSNKNTDTERIPTVYINPDGTATIDMTNCQGYMITNFEEAVSTINDLYFKGDFNAARQAIELANIMLQKTDVSSEEARRTLTKFYGLTGDVWGELGNEDKALEYYKSFQCLKMQLKTNLFRDTKPSENIKLYQFRRFSNYTLANLLNKEITLTSPKLMNDVFDSLVFQWLDSPSYGANAKYKNHLTPFKKSFNDYRIASFCEDNPQKEQYAIQNNLMWSHYADEHRGFCIEYLFNSNDFRRDEFDKNSASRLFRMNYWIPKKDKPINFEDLQTFSSLTSSSAFLTKYLDWSYENEVRLLQYNPQNGSNHAQYKLCGKSRIVAIYFGYRCPDSNKQVIMNLLSESGIKFYQMEINYADIYKFKIKELSN